MRVALTVEKSLRRTGSCAVCFANIGNYGIVSSDSEDTTSSVHTAPDSPSSIVELLLLNP